MVPKGNPKHGTKVLVRYRFLLGRNQRDFLVTGFPTQPSWVVFSSLTGNMPENKIHQACAESGLPSCVLTFVHPGTRTIVVRPGETSRYAALLASDGNLLVGILDLARLNVRETRDLLQWSTLQQQGIRPIGVPKLETVAAFAATPHVYKVHHPHVKYMMHS